MFGKPTPLHEADDIGREAGEQVSKVLPHRAGRLHSHWSSSCMARSLRTVVACSQTFRTR